MIFCASSVAFAATLVTLVPGPNDPRVAAPSSMRAAAPATGTAPAALASRPATSDEVSAPPGLVSIPAGRYEIGADEDFIVELIRENEAFGETLSAELGARPMTLPEFYLMPTEVTNEQYAAFVRATDSRPPQGWASPEALEAAIGEHNRALGERINAAREAGKPAPEREKFDVSRWFDANWKDIEWVVPKGSETLPVTGIDHGDARSYAEWAGLRLMSEFEFQAAARGPGNQDQWPWGDEWDATKSVSLSGSRSQVMPVGSTGFATETGVHDLIGNVWEWTDSPYVAYERYEPLEVELGSGRSQREERFTTSFDANNRVTVGGSADYDAIANRISVRRNTDRTQRTEKLGFRCAATPGNAQDKIQSLMRTTRAALRTDIPLAPQFSLAFQRWLTSPGTAEVEGYAVIEGYDHLAVAPIEKLEVSNLSQLEIQSLTDGPVDFGILTTSVPLTQPPLAPGTYKLSWRGKGEDRRSDEDEEEEEQEDAPEEVRPYDIKEVNLLVTDARGEVVAIFDGSDVDLEKADSAHPSGKLELIPWVPPTKQPKDGEVIVPRDSIDVTIDIPCRKRGRVVRFVFGLELDAGAIDPSWVGVEGKGDATGR